MPHALMLREAQARSIAESDDLFKSFFPSLVLAVALIHPSLTSLSMFALKALLSALLLAQSAFALTQSLLFQIPGKDLKKVQQSSAAVLKCVQ